MGVILGCTKCKIELNESDKQQLKNQKKKVEDSKSYSPISIIQKSCVAERLVYFNGTSIFTDSNEVLQLFRPPTECKYDKELIEDYMKFIESRVIHPEALREEFASHAYRFRNKRAFIEKFFIHYDPAGQSGKSFIFNAFEQIYGKDYAINADPKKILNDQFDSWKTKKLLVWMEEAEPNKRQAMNYDEMKAAVKRLTTRSTAARGMYEENKSAENAAIVGFNTNDETLFGLVRADQATIDRLVIIEFKRDGSKVDWVKMAHKYLENPNFAYSLYKYLCEDYVIYDGYTPNRYRSQEKNEFIQNAIINNKNSVLNWIETLSLPPESKNEVYNDSIFNEFKGKDKTWLYSTKKAMITSYNEYCSIRKIMKKFSDGELIKELVKLGFDEKTMHVNKSQDGKVNKSSAMRVIRISKDEFMKFKTEEDEDEDIDFDNVEFDPDEW